MAMSAASTVEVRRTDPQKGKGLYATSHFKEGDVILKEEPLVSAQFLWNELYNYKACEHCLRSLEPAEEMCRRLTNNSALVLPHPECCTVDTAAHTRCPHCPATYCSEACRQNSWQKSHQRLCMGPSHDDADHPLNRLKDTWRNLHYPPETSSIMLLAKMAAMTSQSADPWGMMQRFSQFVHTTVNENDGIMHKLLGDQFKSQLQVLQAAAREALDIHEILQKWFTEDGFKSAMALIGTNGQGIGSSSISSWVKNCEDLALPEEEKEQLDSFIEQLYADLEKESGDFLDCEGSGLYELQSSCNHSCVPNAEVKLIDGNHVLTLTALQDIQPEEEICISYLGECLLARSRHSRQKILKDNYLFKCACQRCLDQADDPDETSEEEMDDEDVEEMSDKEEEN